VQIVTADLGTAVLAKTALTPADGVTQILDIKITNLVYLRYIPGIPIGLNVTINMK
jgi:hypothetical protein